MPHDDFDVESLAQYLHLTAAQVLRMADRGKLPGRKISGQWRFSQAEIHHWLEERIGASDEQELVQVEGVLERAASGAAGPWETPSLSTMLPIEAIAMPLEARTQNSVIIAMTELAAQAGLVWDPEKMAEAVRARENLHPTALDNGIALLHPRRPLPDIVAEPALALGRTSHGVPFGGSRGMLTDIFFLILSTTDRGHLRTLARLSRLVGDNEFTGALRQADNAQQAHELVEQFEAKL